MTLAGCNQLVSKEPWFQPDPSAPGLRDGIWRGVEADCAFDESAPVQRWPDCADALVVKDGKPVGTPPARADEATAKSMDRNLIWAPGNPVILQMESRSKSKDGKSERSFDYYGANADAQDPAGRITTISIWPIVCGPLGEDERVTKHPWPGLTVAGDNCTAASAETVREAARHSLKLMVEKGARPQFRWVRDGAR